MTDTRQRNRAGVRAMNRPIVLYAVGMLVALVVMCVWSAASGATLPTPIEYLRGVVEALWPALAILPFVAAFTAYRARFFHRASHIDNPDVLAANFFSPPSNAWAARMTEGLRASNASFVFAAYGEFERAVDVLAEIRWRDHPPMVQALEIHALSNIAYVKRDFSEGMRLAVQAEEMTVGGSAVVRKLTAFGVDVGRAVLENDAQVIKRLEAHKSRPGMQFHTPFVYWALSQAYARRGDVTASSIWLARCETALPHARGLLGKQAVMHRHRPPGENPFGAPGVPLNVFSVHRRQRSFLKPVVITVAVIAFLLFGWYVSSSPSR